MRAWTAAAALTLTAASAAAQIDNSALECGSGPTFYPRGDHWPNEPDANKDPTPITYRQQRDGPSSPAIAGDSDLTAVHDAMATWMNHQCATGWPNILVLDANLDFTGGEPHYATRDRGDTWVCPQGGVCGDDCDSDTCNLQAAQNIIYFVPSAWSTIADRYTVALTTNLFIPDTGFVVTADMEFNDEHFDWRAGTAGCTAGAATCFDIRSVALHEFGHFLGLNHVMCADAVMFPEGSGTSVRHTLSVHETTALCTIYPPRSAAATNRDTMEQCDSDSQCPAGRLCIKPAGHSASSPWGWCAVSPCTSDAGCGTGFKCVTADNGRRFCKPGPNGTGGAVTTGTVDPGTGTALDLCSPCTAGAQCSSGVCVAEGGPTGVCTQLCVGGSLPGGEGGTGASCPSGMECIPTDQSWSVCWPNAGSSCGAVDYRGVLNEVCFRDNNPSTEDDDWFKPCGPELLCFGFKPRCEGKEGRCVKYCNATGSRCPDGNMSCCFGVDDNGSCLGSAAGTHGGCFDIRRVGETCVGGEQSICEAGAGCFYFVDASVPLSRCYPLCTTSGTCEGSDVCVGFQDQCQNQFALCCDGDAWNDEEGCVPSDEIAYYDVGVMCRRNEECDSNLCLSFEGESACSRWCNPVTGVGCPGDIDVNADGVADGGFRCLLISGEGRCWPRNGPVEPPGGGAVPPPDGCCSAMSARPGDWLLSVLLFAPVLVGRWRRRR